jgi:hypothetical protein
MGNSFMGSSGEYYYIKDEEKYLLGVGAFGKVLRIRR